MKYSYDEILLERAVDTLGRMLDYSVYSLHYDISAMIGLFIASGTASLFERGDIRTIAGSSGVELAYEVLDRSGIVYERTQPRYTKNLSAEYWYGHALAYMQWKTCETFGQIVKTFSPAEFIAGYGSRRLAFLSSLPLDISETERSAKIRAFGRHFAEEAASERLSAAFESKTKSSIVSVVFEETSLKTMRIRNGLSQSGLAKASGIPVRTIQQYEQRQKDLSKARAEYLIALSRVLNCDPEHLLRN